MSSDCTAAIDVDERVFIFRKGHETSAESPIVLKCTAIESDAGGRSIREQTRGRSVATPAVRPILRDSFRPHASRGARSAGALSLCLLYSLVLILFGERERRRRREKASEKERERERYG